MSDEEALHGAGEATDVAERIQGLENQLARLTKMVQAGIKLGMVGVEEQEPVRAALYILDGGAVVYCQICKNNRHMTEACFTKRATAATTGSAQNPRIHATQERGNQEVDGSTRSEELWNVSGRVTGSAFALAEVSTSASGIENFSSEIKVLVDTGNLLTIGLCVSESFFLSLGENVEDLSPPSFHTAYRASENSVMHTVGDTVVNIKCSDFNNVILSGPAVVLRNLSQQVIFGMNILTDNYLNLDLTIMPI